MEQEKEMQRFIEEHVKVIKPLYKKLTFASFDAKISGKKESYEEYEKIQLEFEKIYNNKEEFEKVKKWHDLEIKDELLRRQIGILYRSYLSSQGDIKILGEIIKKSTEIDKKFNLFRANIKGKEYTDNEIKKILEEEKSNEKLKEAWEASKKQGEIVEKDLIDLIKLRNKLAQDYGFKNYYVRSLEINEQKLEEIEKIFDELAKLTNKPFLELKEDIDKKLKEKYKEEKLAPWHYKDLFFQEGPQIYSLNLDKFYEEDVLEIAKKFYDSLELEVRDILERSDLFEKKGKYQHACCMDMDREGDVRIIQNVRNNEKWMETTLHELGHAVYGKYTDMTLPFLLRDSAHIFVTEAVAQFFGRESRNTEFIKEFGKNGKDADEYKEDIRKMLKLRQLVFCRWCQVMFRFEKELYENPDQDLNKKWWELVKKYQLIDFYRDKPDWASKIHFVSSPVYYHNYMLGELLASQFHYFIINEIFKTDINKESEPAINLTEKGKEVGEWFKKYVFQPGAKYFWGDMIKKATKEDLNPEYFVRQFG